jgi:sugar phosphate isomerase/epimerase
MLLGMSTIVYRNEVLDRGLLEKIKAVGAEAVELTDYHPDFDYSDLRAISALRTDLAALGLQLNSFHAHLKYLDPDCDLAATDASQRAHVISSYREAIDALVGLGGGILVTHDNLIPDVDELDHAARKAALSGNLKEIADHARSHNVRIAVENHGSGYFSLPERLVDLVREVDADNVGVCIDTGHRNLCGDPADAIRVVGEHLITVHIHDNHGEQDEHLLPTHGAVDWDDVIDALNQIGYSGTFMYEIPHQEALGDVERNYQSLRRRNSGS